MRLGFTCLGARSQKTDDQMGVFHEGRGQRGSRSTMEKKEGRCQIVVRTKRRPLTATKAPKDSLEPIGRPHCHPCTRSTSEVVGSTPWCFVQSKPGRHSPSTPIWAVTDRDRLGKGNYSRKRSSFRSCFAHHETTSACSSRSPSKLATDL